MTAINTAGNLRASERQHARQRAEADDQPATLKSYARERNGTLSVDGVRNPFARLFRSAEPSASASQLPVPYVRHHVNVVANAYVAPSAPPAYLMPQEAVWPEHRDPSIPSAPHACLMPQDAVLPEHRNPFMAVTPPAYLMPQPALQPGNPGAILPNGFRQLARR